MSGDKLSQKIFNLHENVESLRMKAESDSGNATEILSDTLSKLQVNLEELSTAYEELKLQNEDLRRSQSKLQKNESIFHSFFDSPGVMRGIVEVISDDDVRHIADNEVIASFLGLTKEAMKGKLGSELGEPQEIMRTRISHCRQSQNTGKPVSFEYLDKRGDHEAWLSVIVSYLGSTLEGNPRFTYVVNDITERKKTEEALSKSETRYKMLFNSISEAFALKEAVFDAEGEIVDFRFIDVNPAFTQHSGLTDVVGKTMLEMMPDIEPQWIERFAQVAKTGEPMRFQDRAGELGRWFDVFTSRAGEGAYPQVAVLFNDITERKRAEEALLKARDELVDSRRRLNEILESITDDLYVLDRDYKFTFINPRTASKLGKKPEDLLGNVFWDVFPKNLGTITEENYRAAMEKREIQRFEIYGPYTKRWYQETVFPSAEGITCIGPDITERKLAEEALRESEERLRLAAHAAMVGTYSYDHTTNHGYYSPEFLELYGLRPGDDLPLDENMTPVAVFAEDRPAFLAAMAAGNDPKGDGIMQVEFRIRKPDGSMRWLMARGKTNFTENSDNPRPLHGTGVIIDVTERKRAEKALRESEERFRALNETSPVGVGVSSAEGVIVYTNLAYERILGYDPGEIIGMKSADLYWNPGERESWLSALKEKGVVRDFEIKLRKKDGTPVWISINTSPISFGDKPAVMGTIQDITERKKAEEALRESEERFRKVFEHAAFGMALGDMDGHVLESNPALEDILGYSKEELRFKSFAEFTHPDDVMIEWPQIEKVIAGQTDHYEIEKRFIRKDGKTIWVRLIGGLTRDISGKPSVGIALIEDITDRKQAEETLRESEHHEREQAGELAAILEAVPNPVIIAHDPECTHMTGNRAANELFKLSSGGEIWLTAPPERRPHHYKAVKDGRDLRLDELPIRRAAKGENVQGFEYTLVFDDGTTRELVAYGTPLRDDQGNPRGAVHTLVDISERKRAEETLRESEAKFRTLVETAGEGITISQPRGPNNHMVFVNRRLADMLGYTAEELLGRDIVDFMFDDDKPLIPSIKNKIHEGNSLHGDFKFLRKDGSTLWTMYNVTPMFDEKGELVANFAMYTDITERKQAEEALHKAKEELEFRVQERTTDLVKVNEELLKAKDAAEESVRAKSAFLANMSHELRTPMNAIIGFTSLMLDEPLSPEHRDSLTRVNNGGKVLLALINDILEFSRAERQKIKLGRQPFSLDRCIRDSLDLVSVQANDKGLGLTSSRSYDTPDVVMGDPGRLRQILANLLSNAVKFTDKGGITISLSSKPLEQNKQRVLFEVKDTGIGIAQDKMDQLFKPFSQVDASISNKYGGTGLGLAISKSLVELMGGKIWAESEPGKGSTFSFTIEAEVAQELPSDSGKAVKAITANLAKEHPLRILIAEDIPASQRVLQLMLEKMGYRADAVADGTEAIQSLRERPYDLVLMDIRMPEMDGLKAAQEIRRLWPDNGPKIVAITAYAMDGDREKCLDAGMDDYLAKPVKIEDLAAMLSNITPPPRIKIRR